MSISEDTRCWLLLPAPRPLTKAPAAVRRYVTSSRTILRWMAALILIGTALIWMVSDERSVLLPAFAFFNIMSSLPLLVYGEDITGFHHALACDPEIQWWRVDLARPCHLSRSRADGAMRLFADRREAYLSPGKYGPHRSIELRLINPLTREIRYAYKHIKEPEIGEEVAIAELGAFSLLFIKDLLIELPSDAIGELPSGHAHYQHS